MITPCPPDNPCPMCQTIARFMAKGLPRDFAESISLIDALDITPITEPAGPYQAVMNRHLEELCGETRTGR